MAVGVTVVGLIMPWQCTGHHAFTCANAIGISWTMPGYHFEWNAITSNALLGLLAIGSLGAVVWLESGANRSWYRSIWLQRILLLLTAIVIVSLMSRIIVQVASANQCELFTPWYTTVMNAWLPIGERSCAIYTTQITDFSFGIWLTLLGTAALITIAIIQVSYGSKRG